MRCALVRIKNLDFALDAYESFSYIGNPVKFQVKYDRLLQTKTLVTVEIVMNVFS